MNTKQIAEDFAHDGYALIKGVFTLEEVKEMRRRADKHAADPNIDPKHLSTVYNTLVLRRCHELDPLYAEKIHNAQIQEILTEVLGRDPRFNALNIIISQPGTAISNWHIDDTLEHPLPNDIPRFDSRIKMPVLWLTVQVALSDIDSLANGPTQFVPGSHFSGRHPSDDLIFEGKGPIEVLCKAGDIYLTNHQCWHRGAPNVSDRTRYVMQLQYGTRWADSRFKGTS